MRRLMLEGCVCKRMLLRTEACVYRYIEEFSVTKFLGLTEEEMSFITNDNIVRQSSGSAS